MNYVSDPKLKGQVLAAALAFDRDANLMLNKFEKDIHALSPLVAYGVAKALHNLRKRLERMRQEVEAMPL